MVHIYEKVCKTEINKYGIREITNENPLKNGPCIITILAKPTFLENINGCLRQVANLVNPGIDNNYDPDRRILGLGFGDCNEQYKFSRLSPLEDELEEFLNKYFYPLFMENDEKIDVLKAMKNFRNITFLTFCNGAKTFKDIEYKLKDKMKEIGYNSSDVETILSQVCLAAISGKFIKVYGTSALCFSFGDVNDEGYEDNKKIIRDINAQGAGYITYDSVIGYAIADDGNHSLKKHMTGEETLSSRIKTFLNTSLDNAIENKNNKIINPITYEKMDRAFSELEQVKKR